MAFHLSREWLSVVEEVPGFRTNASGDRGIVLVAQSGGDSGK
jgi:hypothetical protein